MNERIKELAGRACDIMPLFDSIIMGDYSHSQYNRQIELLLEKFAELLIKECAAVAHCHNNSGEGGVIAQTIKQHFGVEE